MEKEISIFDSINNAITSINDVLWTYILVAVLIGCALWFTFKTHFVQFRMFGHMCRLLADGGNDKVKSAGKKKRHISSFEAFAVSLASRVGTGNLAGVATAIAVGGPGAVFWMWIIALISSASAFIESTLAQLFKIKGKDSFIGGPAYYMEKGLKKKWMAILFAVLIIITFGFAFNSVQSNTLCAAVTKAFNINTVYIGIGLSILTLFVIFGGIQRIAKISSVIVPIMALGYIILAFVIILMNIKAIPHVLGTIIANAFGWKQAVGGGIGAALMQGIKRGLFSNEAGMGSAPNAAATADISHPVKQGLIQALGVFTDTLLICSCTAFIILFSGIPLDGSLNGVQLTQQALNTQIGNAGTYFIAVTLFFFAFSSIIGNYYYGEANLQYIIKNHESKTYKIFIMIYRILVCSMVFIGSIVSLDLAWNMADVTMGLMTLCNMTAIVLLGKYAFRLLKDYRKQLKAGIKSPTFTKDKMPDIQDELDCW